MSINTSTRNGVTTVEIARPEKKNALSGAMYLTMAEAFRAATADPKVKAILLCGQPEIFTSGNDVEDFMARPAGTVVDPLEQPVFKFIESVLACDKPIVAAVAGPAIGIGTTVLLHCDLVYLAETARLAMPFVNLGLVPEFGSSFVVPRLVGQRRAAEMLLLGAPIKPDEAVRLGLANAVLPAAEVLERARQTAERFNDLPPEAVREAKRLICGHEGEALRQAVRAEAAVFGRRLASPETEEALRAFLEKRKPKFD